MSLCKTAEQRSQVVQGVVVIVHRGGRSLMIRRAAGMVAGGAWYFVGGAIKPGETQSEVMVRQLAEEVGGHVEPQRKIWEYKRPDGKLLLHWRLAKIKAGILRPNAAEVAELRWCTPEEVEVLPWVLESNLRFVKVVGSQMIQATAWG
ncbi:MAG: NUDIX domain-containing protein [Phycisphaerae bacterium]